MTESQCEEALSELFEKALRKIIPPQDLDQQRKYIGLDSLGNYTRLPVLDPSALRASGSRKICQKFLPKGQIFLEYPKEKAFGDISTSLALRLASHLKQPPREIAQKLVSCLNEELQSLPLKDLVEKIEIAGCGFINFFLRPEYFYSVLKDTLKTNGAFVFKPKESKNILLEFVSANPTGPLSVAHARQAAVGDVLGNILEFLGHKVKREYYLNDE